MSSVTQRIKEIKQPRGGYIKPSEFEKTVIDDGKTMNENENVHASIIGMAVDYLTRLSQGVNKSNSFLISLKGAEQAKRFGKKDNAISIANELLYSINGIDNNSIICACKLVTFDIWYRNPNEAVFAKSYIDINPDSNTIHNIRILVERSKAFFEKYGPIVKENFDFKAEENAVDHLPYGGYTKTVNDGDGDFLTNDTMWDFKVSKTSITSKHTLQLLMYWIMGQHSGQKIYKTIKNLGIFNPRLNTVYLLNTDKIPQSVIETVEKTVICY